MRYFLFESSCTDPCRNLAIEEFLLKKADDTVILYLWQNENTVVIGKNQNPWKECKTTLLNQEGGTLVRRLSGGGAVYHDLGNLNFTFLMPQDQFDLAKQLSVVLEAVRSFGIDAGFTGRNDIAADGRKFSGNAFYKNGKAAYHHGTLLVGADMAKLNRYLSPSKAKLQAKGVDSVRSRVVNLKELNPEITIEKLKEALIAAFSRIYGTPEPITIDEGEVAELEEKYRSWEWRFGQKLPFTLTCEERFLWGSVQIGLQAEKGIVRQVKVYTDAMDDTLAPRLEKALTGCRLESEMIRARLSEAFIEPAADILTLLERCL